MAVNFGNHNLITNGDIAVTGGEITVDGGPVAGGGGISQDVLSDVVGYINYIGVALPGSLTSASVWTIYKTTYFSDGSISSSLSAKDVAWDDRLTETYN